MSSKVIGRDVCQRQRSILQVFYTAYASSGLHYVFFSTPGDSKKPPRLVLHCALSTFER